MNQQAFWDKAAPKYVAGKIEDMQSYIFTLERTRSYLQPQYQVLEVGCGSGMTAHKLAPSVREIFGTDISSAMIGYAQKTAAEKGLINAHFVQEDAMLSAENKQDFNAILAFNVLHLVKGLPEHLQRYHSMLAPGGFLISKTICLPEKGLNLKFRTIKAILPLLKLFGKAPPVYFYKIAALEKMIERAGFEIVETGNYPAQPPRRFIVARKK
ncbi:class I SAM-dependent methyltransferase [Polycladidibacter stylochi]|uniref:class I SAM-dependent methyltransferase n=1 Tax=Polycladidibacter stylochi TaxID=1807766 RepID=UPI000830225B|nr:class I SAM-dependent methyltransferase [Pseudovibrio stylochi]